MTIQAPNLVARIGAELRHGIDHVFPDTDATEQAQPAAPDDVEEQLRSGTPRDIPAGGSGYVQVIDLDGLVETARKHDLLIRLVVGPGRFVVPSTSFAQAWPADRVDDEVGAAIVRTLVTGARRTPIQDVEFPVRQLAEVAVRSLSPGINDPYTAETCVDQLSVGLCRLADRPFPPDRIADADGAVRVVVGDPVTFERMIRAGFDQIRQCADFHAPVYVHLLAALTRIAERVQDPARLVPLRTQGRLVLEAAERAVPSAEDRRPVEDGHAALVAAAARVEPIA